MSKRKVKHHSKYRIEPGIQYNWMPSTKEYAKRAFKLACRLRRLKND